MTVLAFLTDPELGRGGESLRRPRLPTATPLLAPDREPAPPLEFALPEDGVGPPGSHPDAAVAIAAGEPPDRPPP
jgi:hypothetical protein